MHSVSDLLAFYPETRNFDVMQRKQYQEGTSQEQRVLDESSNVSINAEQWTNQTVFLSAFLLRLLLVFYGRVHDYLFKVNFTDVDYNVFTDAAKYVYDGKSPFLRSTYRYSPLLAWILIPNVFWPEFGKLLFCSLDIVVGWLYLKLETAIQQKQSRAILWFWLFNPFTAVISARGNGDVLICISVVVSLYFIYEKKLFTAALLYGLAVHLKLYPIIYLPSIMLYLSGEKMQLKLEFIKKQFLNWKGAVFLLTSFAVVLCMLSLFYNLYGDSYLSEAILYHIGRTDTRHNFSPYFYLLYLYDGTNTSTLLSTGAFLPQAALIIYFSFRYYDDLPFCWLVITVAFVALNKVCTSQYFLWFICLIPAQANLELKRSHVAFIILLWISTQGLWLLPAYLFEFQGLNTFVWMWLASLLFLVVNSCIVVLLCLYHNTVITAQIQQNVKKLQLQFDFGGLARDMVFYIIGLGLGDVEDVTVRGLNVIKSCSRVYLEAYTSILCYGLDTSALEKFYGKVVIPADRELIEQHEILDGADVEDVCLLVVGDPFGATTHADLVLRAKERNVDVKVIHNASILNAVGCCGLQLYNFGETVSIVMWLDGWEPDSYYDKILSNMEKGLHTLCLLDIKVHEQSIENLMKGRKIYEPPRYLTCREAAKQLLTIAERRGKGLSPDTRCVGLARVGWQDQKITFCTLREMSEVDMGPPLHSLIIPGKLHPLELEFLQAFSTP
uniref:GPI alpha-1,4-mannosyltransferase I, catalytic subunit n=1 Tax=Syphacia muris TaxID=451379 RepID=A0A0N5AU01_9BILA